MRDGLNGAATRDRLPSCRLPSCRLAVCRQSGLSSQQIVKTQETSLLHGSRLRSRSNAMLDQLDSRCLACYIHSTSAHRSDFVHTNNISFAPTNYLISNNSLIAIRIHIFYLKYSHANERNNCLRNPGVLPKCIM